MPSRLPTYGSPAFTLLELMLVVGIIGLMLTMTTVSFRGKWQAEQGRRGAQRVAMTWLKARSMAWREGREWVVSWDSSGSQLHAMPLSQKEMDLSGEEKNSDNETPDPRAFSVNLGDKIRLLSNDQNEEASEVHFFANGRVRQARVRVVDAQGNVWRVKTDWAGAPVMEVGK